MSRDGSVVWGELYRNPEGNPPVGGYAKLVRWTPTGVDVVEADTIVEGFGHLIASGWNATSCNKDGSVFVGAISIWVGGERSATYATRWGPGGRQVLGVLSGTTGSWAFGTDGSGDRVIGTCTVESVTNPGTNEFFYAFLWTPAGGMRSLESVLSEAGVNLGGWELRSADVISVDGSAIAGWGYYQGVKTLYLARLPRIIRKVDTLVDYNAVRHETEGYKPKVVDAQVVRRGSVIEMDVELFEPFTVNAANLRLEATHRFDRAPNSPPGSDPIATTIQIPMYESEVPPNAWGFVVLDERDGPMKPDDPGVVPVRTVSVGVFSPANAPVGEYVLEVVASDGAIEERRRLECNMILLFNATSTDDSVGMVGKVERKDYLLWQSGLIFRKPPRIGAPTRRTFAFEQYSREVLRGTLSLLDGLNSQTRASAAGVCRELAAKVNSNDDDGVLVAKWAPAGQDPLVAYGEGTNPGAWQSARTVFDEYLKAGPVKFAQCMAFAGVLTASARSLGIPSRPVTGWDIAHEYPIRAPLIAPRYTHQIAECWFPVSGTNLYGYLEHIWGFHVWVEAWLDQEWNVIDSTPQEQSEGLYRLGPVRVEDIRNRSDHIHEDVGFMVSAVDADYWKQPGDSLVGSAGKPCVPEWNNGIIVGNHIVTKALWSDAGESRILNYKNALRYAQAVRPFELQCPETLEHGSPLQATVAIRNDTDISEDYEVVARLAGMNERYASTSDIMAPQVYQLSILPRSVGSIAVSVPWAIAGQLRDRLSAIQLTARATRQSDASVMFADRAIGLAPMPLEIVRDGSGTVPIGTEVPVTVRWQNTGDAVVQEMVMRIWSDEGLPFIQSNISDETTRFGPISPGQVVERVRRFTARSEGPHLVSVTVSPDAEPQSEQMTSVNVSRCVGDLTDDAVVDDLDFLRFVIAYNLVDCRSRQMDVQCYSDLNSDGVVDDLDFQMFVAAYDQLVCQ